MTKKLAAVIVALACVNACFAVDITTRSGTTYRKCEVVKVEPDGIRISHDGGAAKISFEELPDALQRQYGYDAAKVAAYRKTVADAKAAMEAKVALARLQADEARKKQAAISEAVAEQQLALQKETAEAPERDRIQKEKEAEANRKAEAEAAVHSAMVMAIGALIVYFIPTVVGMMRGKSNWFAIGVLNLFLGWTFVGWVIALVWACAKDSKPAVQTVTIHLPPQPTSGQAPTIKGVAGRVIDHRQLPPSR